MPRMEPFSPGQVFNVSLLDRVHVLPPEVPSQELPSAVVSSTSANTSISTLVPTILKSVSRTASTSKFSALVDKDTRYI